MVAGQGQGALEIFPPGGNAARRALAGRAFQSLKGAMGALGQIGNDRVRCLPGDWARQGDSKQEKPTGRDKRGD